MDFYHLKLHNFQQFCESLAITQIDQLDPPTLRQFLLALEDDGHNPSGVHAHYRALRTFLNWWDAEVEPEDWKNPTRKVKAPRLAVEPLEPVPHAALRAMLASCETDTLLGARDKAILLALMDTGARASELVAIPVV